MKWEAVLYVKQLRKMNQGYQWMLTRMFQNNAAL